MNPKKSKTRNPINHVWNQFARFLFLTCLLPTFLTSSLFASTNLIIPWVPDNPDFQTKIIINNFNDYTVSVNVGSIREGDLVFAFNSYRLDAFESIVLSGAEVADLNGKGPGYRVGIQASDNHISASAVISSKTTLSGNSPAQINAIPRDSGSRVLSFGSLPINDGNFSAPVVVAFGDFNSILNIWAYKDGKIAQFTQKPLSNVYPFALSTSELFPELEGEYRIVVRSNMPMVGASFLFNQQLEPSMMEATPLPEDLRP